MPSGDRDDHDLDEEDAKMAPPSAGDIGEPRAPAGQGHRDQADAAKATRNT
jgi:hypothetical protein